MKNLRTRIGGAILTLAFIFGISVAAQMTAQAQYRGDREAQRQDRRRDNDDRWNGNQSQNRDWRRDRDRDRDDRWRRNDRNYGRYGNNGSYGNYGGYGNNGGYGNYGGYGNNGGYGNYGDYGNYGGYQAAANQGYQYGLSTGASDAQRGENYSPQRSHYWRNASSRAFRSGFEQGYAQGYRQYGGYGNRGYGNRGYGNRGGILGGVFGRP